MQRHPVLLDFRLTVRYHGLKATQYFSKFTTESMKKFKEDLITLGLPHPRKENISLLSHGAVECFWPSAEQNHVLHKNLIAKTRPTRGFNKTIDELSILTITVKESPAYRAPCTRPESLRPTNLKRSYDQRIPISAPTSQSASTSRGQQGDQPPSQNTSGYRPHHAHPNSGPSSSYSLDDAYRPRKIAKTHAEDFHARPLNNGHPNNSAESSYSRNRLQPQTSTFRTSPVHRNPYFHRPPSPRHINKSPPDLMKTNAQPPSAPSKLGSTVIKVEEGVVDAFLNNLDLHSTVSKREPPTTSEHYSPRPKTTVVALNDLHSVHNAHYSPKNRLGPSNAGLENQGSITAADLDDRVPGLSVSKRRTMNVVGTAMQLPTPPTSAPSSSSISSYSKLQSTPTPAASSLHPALRYPGLSSVQRILPSSGSTSTLIPHTSSVSAKETGASAMQSAHMNPATERLTMSSKDVSQNMSERSEERHGWGIEGQRYNTDLTRGRELERVIRELDAVKKELEEERRSRREDKKLFEAERQRREEAETALADVRRECRQPFVVPSLLDTFVELSRLTTRGLKVSGSRVSATPASGYPSLDGREVETVSRVIVSGGGVTASSEPPRREAQWTEVKREPLDDHVIL